VSGKRAKQLRRRVYGDDSTRPAARRYRLRTGAKPFRSRLPGRRSFAAPWRSVEADPRRRLYRAVKRAASRS
jgi:hypothetical protein